VLLVAANVIAISFSNQELPPFWGAGVRFSAASALFFLIAAAQRLPLPRGRALAGVLLFGVLQFGISFALAYWALVKVPAGLAALILASAPLFTMLFAAAARLEPLRLRGLLGAIVAVGGIAVIYGERAGSDIPPLYLLAAIATTACFSLAPVVMKSFPPVAPAMTNALSMATGSAILIVLSRAAGEVAVIPSDPATWAVYVYLILPGSLGVFALFLYLLKHWTVTAVSFQAVLSPIVTVALSAWLLGEPLTGGLFLGGALVLVGVYAGAIGRARPE
jgi:drug/metabolite transporter (DMT)-like permease